MGKVEVKKTIKEIKEHKERDEESVRKLVRKKKKEY